MDNSQGDYTINMDPQKYTESAYYGNVINNSFNRTIFSVWVSKGIVNNFVFINSGTKLYYSYYSGSITLTNSFSDGSITGSSFSKLNEFNAMDMPTMDFTVNSNRSLLVLGLLVAQILLSE